MSLANYHAVGFYNDVLSVYYSGTDTLQEGYALCYDVAASLTATDPKARLGNQCIKPATANLMAFAGLVGPSSAGKTGPCYIDVIPYNKNRFAYAYCKINATAFSTLLGPVDAQYALGAFSDSTVNLNFVGIAAETADTSTTAAKKAMLFK